MQFRSTTGLSVFLLATTAVAQSYVGEGPGVVVAQAPSTRITNAVLGNGVTEIAQILLVPHPSLGSNVYYGCFTVRRTGGTGGWDGMTGIFDNNTGTFTKNNDVDGLNSTGDEFAATVTPDLLTFAMDTPTGAIYATRAATTGAFTAPAPITGAGGGYIDPQFAQVNGQSVLLFVSGTNLGIGDFNRTSGTVTNVRVLVTNPLGSGCHSPSPMSDLTGESRALIFSAQIPGFSSNAWFTSSLDDSTPKFEVASSTTWLANPDANGGTLTYAEAVGATYAGPPLEVGVVALSSGVIPAAGGNLNLTLFAPQRTAAQTQYIGSAVIGLLGTAGISVPGFFGSPISLSVTSFLVPLPSAPVDRASGTFGYNLPIGGMPLGAQFHAMPLLIDLTANRLYFGNTAYINVR